MYKDNYPSRLLEEAVNAINMLPGVGKRSALRLALHLLRQPQENVHHFTAAINSLRDDVKYCRICRNLPVEILPGSDSIADEDDSIELKVIASVSASSCRDTCRNRCSRASVAFSDDILRAEPSLVFLQPSLHKDEESFCILLYSEELLTL